VRPERKTVRRPIVQPGQIEAFQQTLIFAKISGFVDSVLQDLGDQVENGQTLAVLSVPEMDEELAQKEALVSQARAELERAQKMFAASEARVRIAEALEDRWKSEHERMEKLIKGKGVIDQQSVDEARYQFEAARGGREEAVAQRERAAAEVRVAQAKLQVAQADRRRMAALLDYAEIKAPYRGVITRRVVNKGDFVQPASGNKGEPLFVIMQMDPVRIFVDVPETEAVWITDGTPARVRVQALPGRELEGTVTRSAWALDPRARTLRVEIDIDNPKGELRPGNYAYATIQVAHPKTWTVPASCIVNQGDQSFVYRVENGKAVRTPVEMGLRDGTLVELLRKQVKPAHDGEKAVWEEFTGREEIVASQAATLTDGQTVSVNPGGK
jgi:RND family efflux transporter MFP subunit